MDNQKLFRADMTRQQAVKYGDFLINKEQQEEDYLQNHEQFLQMNNTQLQEQFIGIGEKQIDLEMPPQDLEKKEAQKQKEQFLAQTKSLKIIREEEQKNVTNRENQMLQSQLKDEEAKKIFGDVLPQEKFSPRYVYENFAEVRNLLDKWKEHLSFFERNGVQNNLLGRDQIIRMGLMRQMYDQAERALTSALGALGYQYVENEKGEGQLLENLTAEQIQQAKEENARLREDLRERGKSIDEMVVDQLVEENYEDLSEDIKNLRAEAQVSEEYNFFDISHMSHEYQFSMMKSIKDLIDNNPEKYTEHKAACDAMYQDLYRILEAAGIFSENRSVYEELKFSQDLVWSGKTKEILDKRMESERIKGQAIGVQAETLKQGIAYLLTGKALKGDAAFLLRKYIKMPGETEQKSPEDIAKDCVEMYDESRAILLNLEENIDGTQKTEEILDVVTEEIFIPQLEKVRNFDTKMLENYSEEELLDHAEELQTIFCAAQQMTELARCIDLNSPEGSSVLHEYCKGDERKLIFKIERLQTYAIKARMLAVVQAYSRGTLSEDCFTKDELLDIRRQYNLGGEEDTPVGLNHMLAYAKDCLKNAEDSLVLSVNSYYGMEEIREKYAGHIVGRQLETAHPQYMDAMGFHKNAVEKSLQSTDNSSQQVFLNAKQAVNAAKECQSRIEEIEMLLNSQEIESMSEEQMNKLTAEIERNKERINYLQCFYALTATSGYVLADQKIGDSETVNEPLFRSYASMEGYDSFREMSEEDFKTMCMKLSAGAFAKENASPEEIELYRAQNVEGLLMYKEPMRKHYEMLEEKFHHKVPSVEYIEEHLTELEDLFGNIQVDTNLVVHERDMIDFTKPEDVRLYHLVLTYNAIGAYVTGIANAMFTTGDYKTAQSFVLKPFEKASESVAYLDEPQEAELTQQQKEEQLSQVSSSIQARRAVYDQKKGDEVSLLKAWSRQLEMIKTQYNEQRDNRDSDTYKKVGEAFFDYMAQENLEAEDLSKQIEALENVKSAAESYLASHSGKRMTEKGRKRKELMANLLETADAMLNVFKARNETISQQANDEKKWLAEQEKVESLCVADKFRQLVTDSQGILNADGTMQMEFIYRMAELENYVHKYNDISTPHMVQYKSWLNQARKKVNIIMNKINAALPAEMPQSESVKSDEKVIEEWTSNDAERILNVMVENFRFGLFFEDNIFTEEVKDMANSEAWIKRETLIYDYATAFAEDLVFPEKYPVEKFSEELIRQILEKFYERKIAMGMKLNAVIEGLLPYMPRHMSEKDKELFAGYLVGQTPLAIEALNYEFIVNRCFKSEVTLPIAAEYMDQRKEESAIINREDQAITAGYTKFGKIFSTMELGKSAVYQGIKTRFIEVFGTKKKNK